jgi:AcrR family transcriptional regulator
MTEVPYRQRMHATVLDISARVVASEGLAALQARRIAQEAGCAVGTLYNVFGGLDDLIIATNARTLDHLGRVLIASDAGLVDRSTKSRLLALALAYLAFAKDNSHAWRAVFEHHLAAGADVPEWYRDRQAALFGIVESVLGDAIIDPRQRTSAARALFSAVHGIVALSLDQKLGDFDAAEAERQVRFIVGASADGLEAAAGGGA